MLSVLARERIINSVDFLFNPENCTAIYALHPDDGSLIRLANKTVGIPEVSFEVAKTLKKAYSGPADTISGHDYQRVHAQMLAQFTADSQRRPKIKANNQALRAREKLAQKADIAAQFEKHTPTQSGVLRPAPAGETDDDFSPALRRGLK